MDPLIGIARIGRHDRLTKRVNKIGLRRMAVSTRHRQSFRHFEYTDIGRKGITP